MLRYRPSLEFTPTTALSQSAAIVPHKPKASSATQQSSGEDEQRSAVNKRHVTAWTVTASLQSLLRTARQANAAEEAAVPLEDFTRQLRGEQDNVEVALAEQASVSRICTCTVQYRILTVQTTAANLLYDLFLLIQNYTNQECSTTQNVEKDAETYPEPEKSPAVSIKAESNAVTYEPPERPHVEQELQQSTHLIHEVLSLAAQRQICQARREKAMELQRRRQVLQSNSPAQQNLNTTLTLPREVVETTHIPLETNTTAAKLEYTGVNFSEGTKASKDVQLDPKTLALGAQAGQCYSVQRLLGPLRTDDATSRTEPRSQPVSETRDGSLEDTQTRSSDYGTIGLHADAVTMGLSASSLIPPMTTVGDNTSSEEELPYAPMRESVSFAETSKYSKHDYIARKSPNERRKQEEQLHLVRKGKTITDRAPPGQDHFLGLLDLVKKK